MSPSEQIRLPLRLKESASFENFYSRQNQEVVNLLQSIADPAISKVVFLYGPEGAGKSHLLQATCKAMSFYVSLGMDGVQPELLMDLTAYGLVCMDDADSIAGDASWEEALLTLYESLGESGGRLLIAGRYPPGQGKFRLPDLVTRLASGGVWKVQSLSEEDLSHAIQLRARQRGIEVPDAVTAYLLRRVRRDPNTLFALLDQIDEHAFAHQRRLTVPFVRDLAKRFCRLGQTRAQCPTQRGFIASNGVLITTTGNVAGAIGCTSAGGLV
ncbi:MAG: DnaA regulatory inactivator Hda [Gammaproteobacteria bacterium]|nr:DnaA regulatory inactivator Hda [Gammaproteobacteria bacterium]